MPGGIPVVNPMHINGGAIIPSLEMAVSPQKAQQLSDFLLRVNDVVIARRGAMGRCAVVRPNQKGWLCGTGSMVLRTTSALIPEYLQIFLSSPETIKALEAGAVGSTMINLNQRIMLSLLIQLPSVCEQHEIVRRVEALFKIADDIEKRYEKASAHVDKLTQSILAKAFRGELVPQDPADEPASELLKRIQEERRKQEDGRSPGRSGPRRRGRTKSSTL
jgi:type I restriction enzyme S subunit